MKTKVAKAYLEQPRTRYDKANIKGKQTILTELTKTAGYESKYGHIYTIIPY
ncbi:MAG: hypothetical protein ACR2LN_03340 [Candidatus Levyibacteriota bacterium]